MTTIRLLALILLGLLGPAAAAPADLPAAFSTKARGLGYQLQASKELQRDDHQNLFAAGNLEKVFEHLESLDQSAVYHFKSEGTGDLSLHRFSFAPPLDNESIRELTSIESLTLRRSLEKLKLAKVFVDVDEPDAPEEKDGHFSDRFSYRLTRAGTETPITIRRLRHYAGDHLFILNAVDSKLDETELEQLLESLKSAEAPQAADD